MGAVIAPQCHECGRRTGPNWFLVCLRPATGRGVENVEEWLCGRPKCEDAYNGVTPQDKKEKALG